MVKNSNILIWFQSNAFVKASEVSLKSVRSQKKSDVELPKSN